MPQIKNSFIRLLIYTIGITIVLNSLPYYINNWGDFHFVFSFLTLTILPIVVFSIIVYRKYQEEDQKHFIRYFFIRFGLFFVLSLFGDYIYPILKTIDLSTYFYSAKAISVNSYGTFYETSRDCIHCDENVSEVSYSTKIFSYAMDKSIDIEGLKLPDGVTIVKKGDSFGVYNSFDNKYYDSIYGCSECDFEKGEFLEIQQKTFTSFGMAYMNGYMILPISYDKANGISMENKFIYRYRNTRVNNTTLGLSFLWDLFLKELIFNIIFLILFIVTLKYEFKKGSIKLQLIKENVED